MTGLTIIELLGLLTMASVFPITAGLYLTSRREHELQELKKDFKLLGLDSSATLVEHYGQPFTYVEFVLHAFLPAVLTGLGVLLLRASIAGQEIAGLDPAVIKALSYGFLGAYIFSIQLIYRRYTTFDLQPSVYMNCTLTLIAGLAFNYTAFNAIGALPGLDTTEGIAGGLSAVVAFSLGYFPLLAVRWFNQLTNAALGSDGYRIDSLPLSVIDGVSQFHETRLRDEGIDNVQNLASAKIDQLLARTRFNAQQVLEWIDQAILHTYIDPADIESFRRTGVRKVSDFLELWAPYHFAPVADAYNGQHFPKIEERLAEARRNRALQLQSTPEYLDTLYMAARTGPNIAYIETYWKNLKESAQERQAMAVEEARKEVQSVVTKTQEQIFREIGRHNLHDGMRETLASIAATVTGDPADLALDDERFSGDSDALVGLAWWLWSLSTTDEADYTEAAARHYESALAQREDDAGLLYEVLAFYTATGAHEPAREVATRAVALFQDAGDSRHALLAQAMVAAACMKGGQVGAGQDLIQEINAKLDAGEVDGWPETDPLALRGVSDTFVTLFGEDGMPAEVATLQSRLQTLPAGGEDKLVIPTGDIPPS